MMMAAFTTATRPCSSPSPSFIYSWFIKPHLRTIPRIQCFGWLGLSEGKISSILLEYPTFEGSFFYIFMGKTLINLSSYIKQLYIKLGLKPMSMIVKRGGTRTNLKLDWTTQKEGVTKICMHCCCAILLALMQSDLNTIGWKFL